MLFNKDNISIGFSAKNKDMNLGSYRIFINDLNSYFKELGIKSKIGNINAQVIIHPKSESFELDSKKSLVSKPFT